MKRFAYAASCLLSAVCCLAGERVFVTNERAGTVSVIENDRVVATFHAGARPRGIVLSPDHKKLLVASSHMKNTITKDRDSVRVFDAETLKEIRRFDCGTDPEGIAVTGDGRMAIVSNEDAGTATIIDTASGKSVSVVTGTEPEGVAVHGTTALVTGETSSTITKIDLAKKRVEANFFVDARPRAVTFTRNGARAYASAEVAGTINVIDVMNGSVQAKIRLGPRDHPVGVALSKDERQLYAATGRGNSVAVIDTKTNRVTATIPVGQRPWGLGLSGDGKRLYVANGLSNDVSVIDTTALRVVATIRTGDGPWGIAIR